MPIWGRGIYKRDGRAMLSGNGMTAPERCENSTRSMEELRGTSIVVVKQAAHDVSWLDRTIAHHACQRYWTALVNPL